MAQENQNVFSAVDSTLETANTLIETGGNNHNHSQTQTESCRKMTKSQLMAIQSTIFCLLMTTFYFIFKSTFNNEFILEISRSIQIAIMTSLNKTSGFNE